MVDSVEPRPGDFGDALDDVVEAMAHKCRRFVLHYLDVSENSVPTSELADRLAEWGGYDRGTAHLTLRHVHLPKLSDSGLVDVDRDVDEVRISAKGRRANRVRSAYIDRVIATCG